jgi:hypothetical protein
VSSKGAANDVTIEYVANCAIAYDRQYVLYVREYYLYCVSLLKQALSNSKTPINLIVGHGTAKFANRNKTYQIALQYEHTLVKQGGRDSQRAPFGNVLSPDGSAYMVRIENYESYAWQDFVIDYSLPNIANIRSHRKFDAYLKKSACISPLLYSFDPQTTKNRFKPIVTTFNNENEPRRKRLLDQLSSRNLAHGNEKGHFSHDEVATLYRSTQILVNIHQTDHHHTFEELRVLPALLCGCIVVSEDVPLKEHIPYREFIVWADYGTIAEKVKEVHENYTFYFQKIFTNPKLGEVIEKMAFDNTVVAKRIVRDVGAIRAQMIRERPFRFLRQTLVRVTANGSRPLRQMLQRR